MTQNLSEADFVVESLRKLYEAELYGHDLSNGHTICQRAINLITSLRAEIELLRSRAESWPFDLDED